ncbi:MAG TPA: transcription elongation factor GreA [Anaerolineae bacterium]|nr:transcription elongation factor GreA [Anaerolineae bacterium]
MQEDTYLTAKGYKRLQEELNNLKGPIREKLAKKLRAAIQQGDLSENADYISAKEEQGFIEGRILELEQTLKYVVIIDEQNRSGNIIEIGSRVTIKEGNHSPETFQLVGSKETDPINGRISYKSPIGKAILEHQVGDKVLINTPKGSIEINILEIN